MLGKVDSMPLVAAVLSLATLSGCTAGGGIFDPGGGPGHSPSGNVHIPSGHMPPPGGCRIWYPDRPPGQQPPPGACSELQKNVPPGAILVRG